MGKKVTTKPVVASEPSGSTLFSARKQGSLDPNLASLFSQSFGPVQAPKKHQQRAAQAAIAPTSAEEADLSDVESDQEDDITGNSAASFDKDDGQDAVKLLPVDPSPILVERASPPAKKRRRKHQEDDLEGLYLQKLAREEEKENAERDSKLPHKRRKIERAQEDVDDEPASEQEVGSASEADGDNIVDEDKSDMDPSDVPQHETVAPKVSQADADIDKAPRTIFLANVSSTAIMSKSAKKTLLTHLSSFLSTLLDPSSTTKASTSDSAPHKLVSLRFRSTAYDSALPKKAAFAQRTLMPSTTPSTNAYAVYSTRLAARTAARTLNGTIVLGRHLRADEVAHPQAIDHRRCVFVGNLGFVDDETQIKAAEVADRENSKDGTPRGKPSSSKPQKGDVEEGLWRQFKLAGAVESVRVIRDPKTRVGKGFAYVQFADQNGVEAALLFNEKKFPPLLPRKLRVTRAKKPSFTALAVERASGGGDKAMVRNQPSRQPEGRARKLFGRAGAAESKRGPSAGWPRDGIRKPEAFVFEGHRASSKQGGGSAKGKGKSKSKNGKVVKGKPTTRSAKRGEAWKKNVGTGQISGRRAGRD